MLKNYLKDRITVAEKVDSWEQSIRLASEKLLEDNCITKTYIDSMINNIVKNGPYVVIIPKVAIPHSRPEDGANDTAISLLKLNTPVKYPGDKEVMLVFILAARDSNSHIGLIEDLVDILQNKDTLEKVMESQTIDEIKNVLL